MLGLGSGVQKLNVDWHHVDWDKPVTHLRETVRNIRAFWAGCTTGEPIDLPGEREPMKIRGYKRPYPVQRTDIPIHLAAMGPALTRLSGEIADGWISHELTSPAFLRERILPEIEAGLERGGRTRDQIEVVTSSCCSVDADPAVARRRSAGMVGFYATVRTYADFFDFHGLADDQQKVIDAFAGATTAGELAGHVSDAMVDTLTLSGTRDQVAEQIAAYDGIADTIKLTPPTHGLSPDEIRAAQREVIAVIARDHRRSGMKPLEDVRVDRRRAVRRRPVRQRAPRRPGRGDHQDRGPARRRRRRPLRAAVRRGRGLAVLRGLQPQQVQPLAGPRDAGRPRRCSRTW